MSIRLVEVRFLLCLSHSNTHRHMKVKLSLRDYCHKQIRLHKQLLQHSRNEQKKQQAKENIGYYTNLANTHT